MNEPPKIQSHQDIRDALEVNEDWRTFVALKEVFTPEQCAEIIALGGEMKPGTVEDTKDPDGYRDSNITWIRHGEASRWLFRHLRDRLMAANKRAFHFKLVGFSEPLQLSAYGPAQHYDWHLDIGKGKLSTRKLSFVVQLTDPAEYEGGGLQLAVSRKPSTMPRDQGSMVVFPTFALHRVIPVKQGLRHSLVGWIGGPPFA